MAIKGPFIYDEPGEPEFSEQIVHLGAELASGFYRDYQIEAIIREEDPEPGWQIYYEYP